jgi:hypothetical protein
MMRQRGKLVKHDDGTLEYVTWYEDLGPGRARQVFAGVTGGGGSVSAHTRRATPTIGRSITQSPTVRDEGEQRLLTAVENSVIGRYQRRFKEK